MTPGRQTLVWPTFGPGSELASHLPLMQLGAQHGAQHSTAFGRIPCERLQRQYREERCLLGAVKRLQALITARGSPSVFSALEARRTWRSERLNSRRPVVAQPQRTR